MASAAASPAKSDRSAVGGRQGSAQRACQGHGESIASSWMSGAHRRRVVDGGELGGRGKSSGGLDTRLLDRFFEVERASGSQRSSRQHLLGWRLTGGGGQ
jgi:hypothetical protein